MGGGDEPYAIQFKQVTNFGVIKFAVSKFIFELLWFGLVFAGGGREYAITVSKIIIRIVNGLGLNFF